MIKQNDYNDNPGRTFYVSSIDIDLESKAVLSDILQSCTITPNSFMGGYYDVLLQDGSIMVCWRSNIFLTMEEAIKHHNKEINKALSGLDKFAEDLKRRLIC